MCILEGQKLLYTNLNDSNREGNYVHLLLDSVNATVVVPMLLTVN